jgi:hypothetical protein
MVIFDIDEVYHDDSRSIPLFRSSMYLQYCNIIRLEHILDSQPPYPLFFKHLSF